MARFVLGEGLLRDGDRVVVGFSGGADSTALLHALSAMARGRGPRVDIVAAHFDHGLRRGSARDAAAARETARGLGVPFRTKRMKGLEKKGGSLEQACRRVRYAFLASVARKNKAQVVAVAHQADDRAETVLHRLLQGATLRGLAGIPLRRPLPGAPGCEVIRPLLGQDRESILSYLRDRGIEWREDPTNHGSANARARIRNAVLPSVLASYPQARASLLHLELLAGEASRILEGDLRERSRALHREAGLATLPRSAFGGLDEEGIRRLLGNLLHAAGCRRTAPPLAAVRRLGEALRSGDRKTRRVPIGQGTDAESGPDGVLVRRRRPG